MNYGLCLSVSATSATSTLNLYDCNPADIKQFWQYNNTVITSEYYSDYALTDSPLDTYVDLDYSGRNYFQYWEDGTNTAPVSPTIISLKNHVSKECLNAYYAGSSTYYVQAITCNNADSSQQWAWFDNHLQSMNYALCLTVSSSGTAYFPYLSNCNPADIKQSWQYNNTMITSEYYSDYALTDSSLNTYVALYYSGRNYFQYWEDGTNTSPVSPNVISLKNYVSGECLYVYTSDSNYYVKTTTCNNADVSQQWAWFDNYLQSIGNSFCLTADSSSATGTLRLHECNPADTKQYWQYNNTVITSEYYSDYALTDSPISAYVDLDYSDRNYFQYWEDGTNTVPVSPIVISLKNHVSEKCLHVYTSGSSYYVKATICDATDTTQQWAWFDNYLQSMSNAFCLTVSSSSATSTLYLTNCNSADIKQPWQYNNTMIIPEYYPSYALTNSPISTDVALDYSGRNYFQYWESGDETSPVSPTIIFLQNHVTKECLYTYSTNSDAWHVGTKTCDSIDVSQQWAWFGNVLQSMDNALCLSVSSSSATSALFLTDCNPYDTKLYWTADNNTLSPAIYYYNYCLSDNGYCLAGNWNSQTDLEECTNDQLQYWDYGINNISYTAFPTISTTNPTEFPTVLPTDVPTASTYNPTSSTHLDTDTGGSCVVPIIATIGSTLGVMIIGAVGWCIHHHLHTSSPSIELTETLLANE